MAEETKRGHGPDSDSDDDDFGPTPLPAGSAAGMADEGNGEGIASLRRKKKRKRLENEEVYVNALPDADMYEKSYMHRDIVTHCVFTPGTDFLVTGSSDGHVKFWKKMPEGIEFVKHYHAHLGKSKRALRHVNTILYSF